MNGTVDLRHAQRRLLWVWALGTLMPFLLLFGQSVAGRYGDEAGRAWNWFIPAVLPTLTVIVGAIAYGARGQHESKSVDALAYSVAQWLSVFYLLLLSSLLLLQPLATSTPLQWLESSKVWLVAVHGLVGVSLGAFFTSTKG
jgi:hypothetical protein